MKNLLNLKGAKALNRNEQKEVNGGLALNLSKQCIKDKDCGCVRTVCNNGQQYRPACIYNQCVWGYFSCYNCD